MTNREGRQRDHKQAIRRHVVMAAVKALAATFTYRDYVYVVPGKVGKREDYFVQYGFFDGTAHVQFTSRKVANAFAAEMRDLLGGGVKIDVLRKSRYCPYPTVNFDVGY